jgi:uncharacterized protein (DUF433 family)
MTQKPTVAHWRGHPCRETSKAHNRRAYPIPPPIGWEPFHDPEDHPVTPTLFPPQVKFEDILARATTNCPSITMNPRRMNGLPCVDGTRIPVHLVLWAIEHHGSIEGAIEAYPDLTVQQVKDALYFAEIVIGAPSVLETTSTS